jgi:uncharacterized OB-fold protein
VTILNRSQTYTTAKFIPVTIGMKVEMVTRKIREDIEKKGMIVYGYKFRPVMQG